MLFSFIYAGKSNKISTATLIHYLIALVFFWNLEISNSQIKYMLKNKCQPIKNIVWNFFHVQRMVFIYQNVFAITMKKKYDQYLHQRMLHHGNLEVELGWPTNTIVGYPLLSFSECPSFHDAIGSITWYTKTTQYLCIVQWIRCLANYKRDWNERMYRTLDEMSMNQCIWWHFWWWTSRREVFRT